MMIREEDLTYSQLTPNIQNSQEIVSRLSSISELGKIDVLMYLVLLDSGPLIARMLAKKMNLGRVRTYQCLEKLRNHGLVTTTLSNPSFCEAVKPNDAFTTILQKKNDEVMAVKKTVKQISQLFKKTKFCNLSSNDTPKFNIIQGRLRIYSHIGKFIERAANTIYLVTSAKDLMRMYYTSIPEKIKISQCNGAKVRILTEIKHGKVISLLNKFNANEIRMHSLPSKARVIVEKDRILVMSGAIDDINLNGDTENSICTDCPEMIDSMYALYDRLWDKAKQTNKKR